ncbi:MAG TPA: hypothetical protein VII13_02340 [Vicinamibacteria bacterium]
MTRPAGLLLATALLAAPASAGTLEVRVPPGTEVVLTALDHELRAVVRDAAGAARFTDLPSGAYRVAAGSAVAEVRLLARERVVLEVQGSGLGETRREERGYGFAFDADDLRALPSSRDAWSLLETAEPLAIADRLDNGGLYAGENGRTTLHGASWTQTSFRLGALEVADPLGTGTPLLYPDVRGLAAVDAWSAAVSPALGGGAGVIGLEPRRPPAAWHGALEARTLLGGAQDPGEAPAAIARFRSWKDGYLEAGGPLVRERLGLFVAAALTSSERFERDEPLALESERRLGLAHLVWRTGEASEARLLVLRHALDRPFAGRFRLEDAGDEERARFTHLQAAWLGRGASGRTLELAAGYQKGAWTSEGAADSAAGVERLLRGPIPSLPLPGEAQSERFDLVGSWTAPMGGRHLVTAGVEASWQATEATPSPGTYLTAELLDGVGARLWEARVPRVRPRATARAVALHARDQVDLGRLLVEGGLRLESVHGQADLAPEAVDWQTLSPHAALRLDLLADGRLALHGSFSQRHLQLRLAELAFGDAAAAAFDVYRWDDDGDQRFEPAERGPLVAREGGGLGPDGPVGALDPELERPRAREWLAGLSWRFRPAWRLSFFGIDRRETALTETVEVGVGLDDYDVILVTDPAGDLLGPQDDQLLPVFARDPASFGRDRLLLTNPDEHTTRHQGVELALAWRAARGGFLFGATAHRSEGAPSWRNFRPEENDQGLAGELFDDPNADQNPRGRLYSDRAYTIKIAGWRALPWDLRLGAVARYQDGQNFSRLVLADLPQGREAVRAVPNGRHRFTYTLTVDARLEKEFGAGRARVGLVAEAFNLLQTAHETEEYVVTGAAFRTPTARQPPRAFRAGVRASF